ncbi:AbrB/MazE/SpoVT family DNA-binding domain-containing protein [Streptomyces echinatus]|uniref:AbrB/MazE/SpoVT family DNA-binding domain-containing protein n=1 Tax=Streptomyces echinatus TaxID=67293 RepID=UPI00378CCBE2
MIREPAEVRLGENGAVEIPLGILAEAGLDPGSLLVAYSDGDGRVVLRRQEDVIRDLLERGEL